MAEALISFLLEQLASIIQQQEQQEVRLVVNAKKEVAMLSRNLQSIRAVLENAEERQLKEVSVRHWLDSLKDVFYETDDVLDEWNTEILHGKEARNARITKKKVCFFCIPAPGFYSRQASRIILRRDIALKIKEVNESLALVVNESHHYNLQHTKRGTEELEAPKCYSSVDISRVIGRDNEKIILVSKLLDESSERGRGPLVIPIVGMGGIGKTTLAQLVYNDEKVQAHFENRIWVCVSDPFDEIKIAKVIAEGLRRTDISASNDLQTLLEFIHESIESRKFLLVLDGVWSEDWKQLMLALQNGARGSRIVVTTRKMEVARMMGATIISMIYLRELSEESCWSLFCHIAFLADRRRSESEELDDIGKKIVKKCEGNPLSVKILGGLMRYKKTREEWEDVLNSNIWEFEEVAQRVFQTLLLSYFQLAPAIRVCLHYCVIFPKDEVIYKDELIELWMSQNYLNLNSNKEKRMVGEMYFESLVMRCFFQDFTKDVLGNIISCTMHEIVHDFVQSMTKNEILVVEISRRVENIELLGKCRHLALKFVPEGPFPIQTIKETRTLATFDSKITSVDPEFFLQLRSIRTLNLSFNPIEKLPKEIGELIHLRYLDLSCNYSLKKLPNSVCNLFNLQTLRLIKCRQLEELPQGMGKLISLQNLHVWRCTKLKFPKVIARLTSLQTIDDVRIHGDDIANEEELFRLSDLRNMDQLHGSVRILLGKDLKDAGEAKEAKLVNKKHLVHLQLHFWTSGDQQEQNIQQGLLNGLQPHENLESLAIGFYSGRTMGPQWMTGLHNLRSLSFVYCDACGFLPGLGNLASLESLEISGMWNVRKVGVEFLGIDHLERTASASSSSSSGVLFPKLKELAFDWMPELEEWEGMETRWSEEEDSQVTIMPCLSTLQIYDCHRLNSLPDYLRKAPLQKLSIQSCRMLAQRCAREVGEEFHKISHIPNISIQD